MNNQTPLSIKLTSLSRHFYGLLDRGKKKFSRVILLALGLVLLLFLNSVETHADSMTFTTDTTLTEDATIAAGETWTVIDGITLTIATDVTVTLEENGSLFDNSGMIQNSGTIDNVSSIIRNSGIIHNISEGIIFNSFEALIDNIDGTIVNDGFVNNLESTISNSQNGTIENAGAIRNSEGAINNSGLIDNTSEGIIDNDIGLIENNVEGTIDNAGIINNPEGATINNSGTINDDCGGILEGTIPTSGNPVNDRCDPDIPEGFSVTNLQMQTSDFRITENLIVFRVTEFRQGNTDLNDDGDTEDDVVHVYDLSTGITTNLKLEGSFTSLEVDENLVAIGVSEFGQGNTDLNDDGDSQDRVVHVYDARTGITTNLKLATEQSEALGGLRIDGNLVVFEVPEYRQDNTDLNDDGDTDDWVVHVYDVNTGITTNLKLVGGRVQILVAGNLVAIGINESRQGNTDLNDDGDTSDTVVHVHDLSTGITTNLKIVGSVLGVAENSVIISVSESRQGNTDLNDDGDTIDAIVHVYDLSTDIATNLKLGGSVELAGNSVFIRNNSHPGFGGLHVHDLNTGITTNLNFSVEGGSLRGAGNLVIFTNDVRTLHVYDIRTGIITNLKLALPGSRSIPQIAGNLVVFHAVESRSDLNDDGDSDDDDVVHVYDAGTGTITNLKLIGNSTTDGNLVTIAVRESDQDKTDLNDDGDSSDKILHIYNSGTSTITNLKFAVEKDPVVQGSSMAFAARESRQGKTDLNNDGDISEDVLHIVRFDSVSPVFEDIPDVTEQATGPEGAIVEYPLPRVTDDTDPSPIVICEPTSGSQFALGVTKVTCTATDFDGNEAATSFTVRVVSEIDAPLTFTPIADATIKPDSPTENFGAMNKLNADMNPGSDFLLKFDVSGIGMRRVQSATLRLFCTNKSDQGGEFHQADNDWSEDSVTWENAPLADREIVASLGQVVRLTWVEVDLTSLITEDGVYSLRVMSLSRDGVDYRSKEKPEFAPELVITFQDTLTFTPIADATIKRSSPIENFGAVNAVRTGNRPVEDFLMKFDVSGIGTRTVKSATLRLFCTNKSDVGGEFHQTDNDWSEDTVTWDTAPLATREVVASLGPVAKLTWVDVDLTSLITEDGTYSLRIMSPSEDGAVYRSKEKPGLEPELILTMEQHVQLSRNEI